MFGLCEVSEPFQIWIIWGRKINLKSGPQFLVAAHIKGCGRRKFILPDCLSSLHWQVHLSWPTFFSGARIYFFEIPMWTENWHLASTSLWFQHQTGSAETSSIVDGTATWSLAFCQESHCCTSRIVPISYPDKSLHMCVYLLSHIIW